MFLWFGYGQLDYGRFNLSYSKTLLHFFTAHSCLSGNTAFCRTVIKRDLCYLNNFSVKCSISHQTIVRKRLPDLQRMYIFTPANSNIQAEISIREDRQSWRVAVTQVQIHSPTWKLHLSLLFIAFRRSLCHFVGM